MSPPFFFQLPSQVKILVNALSSVCSVYFGLPVFTSVFAKVPSAPVTEIIASATLSNAITLFSRSSHVPLSHSTGTIPFSIAYFPNSLIYFGIPSAAVVWTPNSPRITPYPCSVNLLIISRLSCISLISASVPQSKRRGALPSVW